MSSIAPSRRSESRPEFLGGLARQEPTHTFGITNRTRAIALTRMFAAPTRLPTAAGQRITPAFSCDASPGPACRHSAAWH